MTLDVIADDRGVTSRGGFYATSDDERYAAWFHELDAWTEYWDIFHPETHGRYYFGNGADEPGLLRAYLPRDDRPPVFRAWVSYALETKTAAEFADAVRDPAVAGAIVEVDHLIGRLFGDHFGDATNFAMHADYIEATFRFAIDSLPPAPEREALLPQGDPRRHTAGRHTLDGDLMWFAWAIHLAAADILDPSPRDTARRALMMAGIASGCPANFAWRGHRRTRTEYRADPATACLLRHRGSRWAVDLESGHDEVRALFRIREWGPSTK
jgi:hypothetical protein